MNRELARKSPAMVLRTQPIQRADAPMGRATIVFTTKARADAKLADLYRRGRIAPEWTVRDSGRSWSADVTFIERPMTHRRPVNIFRIVAFIIGAAFLVPMTYLVAKAVAIAVAAMIPFIIGGVLILIGLALVGGRKVVNVIQNVTVK